MNQNREKRVVRQKKELKQEKKECRLLASSKKDKRKLKKQTLKLLREAKNQKQCQKE